jgi:hypothetical protein
MNIVFNNKSQLAAVVLEYENRRYSIAQGGTLELPTENNTVTFSVRMDDIPAEDFGYDISAKGLKNKLLNKLAKTASDVIAKIAINTQITYEFTCDNCAPVIDLSEDHWSMLDGDISMFVFESTPVTHRFCRAESYNGTLTVTDSKSTNLKSYLRIVKGWLLFAQWGSLLTNLLLFLPYYTVVKVVSSDSYFSRVIKRLYRMSPDQRQEAIDKNDEKQVEADTLQGCLKLFFKISLVVLIIILIVNAVISLLLKP